MTNYEYVINMDCFEMKYEGYGFKNEVGWKYEIVKSEINE